MLGAAHRACLVQGRVGHCACRALFGRSGSPTAIRKARTAGVGGDPRAAGVGGDPAHRPLASRAHWRTLSLCPPRCSQGHLGCFISGSPELAPPDRPASPSSELRALRSLSIDSVRCTGTLRFLWVSPGSMGHVPGAVDDEAIIIGCCGGLERAGGRSMNAIVKYVEGARNIARGRALRSHGIGGRARRAGRPRPHHLLGALQEIGVNSLAHAIVSCSPPGRLMPHHNTTNPAVVYSLAVTDCTPSSRRGRR
jgi:hypothetical protein